MSTLSTNIATSLATTAAQANSPGRGWQAHLSLGFECRGSRTVLAKRRRQGPLAVQRPFYPEGDRCHVYLLHPPGGIVGGDLINIGIDADSHTQSLLTTPGAAKFYRSAGSTAFVRQTLSIDDGADVEWLPQENIYFTGCDASVSTRVDLRGDGAVTLWDMQCFGRPANHEPLDDGRVDIGLEVYRDKTPLLLERQRVHPGNRRFGSLLRNQPVTAVFVASHTTPAHLQACRDATGDGPEFAITQMQDLLVARYLGGSTNDARKLLVQVWLTLRRAKTHGCVAVPRIWLT